MVSTKRTDRPHVLNDLEFSELQRTIVVPWHSGNPFTISGVIIRSSENVTKIRIAHTPQPTIFYAEQHYARMNAAGIADLATDTRLLPFGAGEDLTYDLLFSGSAQQVPDVDLAIVKQLCERLPKTTSILEKRTRKNKQPYEISDEYDVQDLLHSLLRGFVKYSIQQETPLPKVAGAKSSRADLLIEDLGILIEIKYAHGPNDQKRIFEEYSQDLVLYAKWNSLTNLLFVISPYVRIVVA
uniref:Uncharacterized protein n=1 Tax=Candidatus Kentrum sp. LFY TaxID=2126342 RepID=A0A450X551_9GAMM|nr:MAG: hypothetical protein BECKLFY1418C_GA0070996_11765 [Candidatus Kentron sp. LFY]